MFDIGFSELLLIAVVALVVLGPERLPRAARFAGLWVRRARAQWYSVKAELEQDLAAEELRRSLRDTEDAFRGVGRQLQDAGDGIQRGFAADGAVPPDDSAGLMRSTRVPVTGKPDTDGGSDYDDGAEAPRTPDDGAGR